MVFYTAAPRPHLGGSCNVAPAEDLHNKNPSLTLSGKNLLRCGSTITSVDPSEYFDRLYGIFH